jgi:hypothetical protein
MNLEGFACPDLTKIDPFRQVSSIKHYFMMTSDLSFVHNACHQGTGYIVNFHVYMTPGRQIVLDSCGGIEWIRIVHQGQFHWFVLFDPQRITGLPGSDHVLTEPVQVSQRVTIRTSCLIQQLDMNLALLGSAVFLPAEY